jgi:hypothetical protein
LAALLDLGFLRTLEAAVAALLLVTSEFVLLRGMSLLLVKMNVLSVIWH